jgi:hypothetical protein
MYTRSIIDDKIERRKKKISEKALLKISKDEIPEPID